MRAKLLPTKLLFALSSLCLEKLLTVDCRLSTSVNCERMADDDEERKRGGCGRIENILNNSASSDGSVQYEKSFSGSIIPCHFEARLP